MDDVKFRSKKDDVYAQRGRLVQLESDRWVKVDVSWQKEDQSIER